MSIALDRRCLSAIPTAHVFGLDRCWWLWVAHLVERGSNTAPVSASVAEERTGGMDVDSTVFRDDVAFRLGVAVKSFGNPLRKL
jgi:hypothetical protein